MTELVGLGEIDWTGLSQAPGSAQNVPALLSALASAPQSARAKALVDLKRAIHPGYATYAASSAAVPFLVQMALDTERDDAAALLEMLARLAVGQARVAEGVNIRDDVDRWRVQMLQGGLLTYEESEAGQVQLHHRGGGLLERQVEEEIPNFPLAHHRR